MIRKNLLTVLFLGVLGTLIVIGTIKFLPIPKAFCKNCTHESAQEETESTQELVKAINSDQDFGRILNSKKPMIIKFHAHWCGACTYAKGPFSQVANESSNIHFYEVDIDNQDIMNYVDKHKVAKIEALPTFVFFKNGKAVEKFVGIMNTEQLKSEIKKIFS